jgi:hypothetical protein
LVSSRAAAIEPPAPKPRQEWGETVPIAIDSLRSGPSLRERGIDAAHVATLAEVADSWPPIVVNRSDRSVIDRRVSGSKQGEDREGLDSTAPRGSR